MKMESKCLWINFDLNWKTREQKEVLIVILRYYYLLTHRLAANTFTRSSRIGRVLNCKECTAMKPFTGSTFIRIFWAIQLDYRINPCKNGSTLLLIPSISQYMHACMEDYKTMLFICEYKEEENENYSHQKPCSCMLVWKHWTVQKSS